MKEAFLAKGVPQAEASDCAEVLIESDKRGIDSHGIGRLKPIYFDRYAKGILTPYIKPKVLRETAATAMVDGQLVTGLYIGPFCMRMAIAKAKQHGVGFVCAMNSTHYGIAGYYATMATREGCVGLTGTNARPSIAPTFGTAGMLGTNPLTWGIPTNDDSPSSSTAPPRSTRGGRSRSTRATGSQRRLARWWTSRGASGRTLTGS